MQYRYADIILPLAQPAYTFAVGAIESLSEGDAVAVQFGARAVYTGIVLRLHNTPPARGEAKPIIERLYERPLLSSLQIKFWQWLADYYMCHIGEVMRIALPSTIKPHARTSDEFRPYMPEQERMLRLESSRLDDEAVAKSLGRAPRRRAVVEQLREGGGELPRSVVDADAATIAALVKMGVVTTFEREAQPSLPPIEEPALPLLSEPQTEALGALREALQTHNTALLHGVTSSGKTEIYAHLMAETLNRGEDVLFLVPEISLTTQLVARLRQMFGKRVTSYHSRLTPSRRTHTYMDVLRSPSGNLVVGPRSALFLPFERLGLVVIDEEHDASYKQTEPSPRYNGRDSAIMLAAMHGAKCVMGSATPSIESYANVLSGKYASVSLSARYGEAQPPRIIISDTIRAVKRGERKSHFNKVLLDKIAERLECGEQVMLFQNRRGYAPYVECPECGWTARCPHCNVSLTQHRAGGVMQCHYCGYKSPTPSRCPACRRAEVRPMGFGTERIEEVVGELFPSARVLRLDGDTATSDGAYNRIISAFAAREADILIGTQIISKGLDFDGVTLIGILNADNLLNAPDFRAAERAWQTIVQIAGRAGRRNARGEVVVQTAEPSHPLFAMLDEACYEQMAATLLAERKMFSYPPYSRLIRITLRDSVAERLVAASEALGRRLRERFSSRVVGPAAPLIDRIRQQYIVEIMVKIEASASAARARSIIRDEVAQIRAVSQYRQVTIICDVDIL